MVGARDSRTWLWYSQPMLSLPPLPAALFSSSVWSLLTLRNLKDLLDLYPRVRAWLPAGSDLYEILDYESTLELCDTKGATARFQKRQRVKFLQNNIIAFEDYVWGDGDVLAEVQ